MASENAHECNSLRFQGKLVDIGRLKLTEVHASLKINCKTGMLIIEIIVKLPLSMVLLTTVVLNGTPLAINK